MSIAVDGADSWESALTRLQRLLQSVQSAAKGPLIAFAQTPHAWGKLRRLVPALVHVPVIEVREIARTSREMQPRCSRDAAEIQPRYSRGRPGRLAAAASIGHQLRPPPSTLCQITTTGAGGIWDERQRLIMHLIMY